MRGGAHLCGCVCQQLHNFGESVAVVQTVGSVDYIDNLLVFAAFTTATVSPRSWSCSLTPPHRYAPPRRTPIKASEAAVKRALLANQQQRQGQQQQVCMR